MTAVTISGTAVAAICERLKLGQKWLIEQRRLWLVVDHEVAGDESLAP